MTRAGAEKHLQAAVEQHLHLTGWRFFHAYDSRRSIAGFPDLVCLRGRRLVVLELKTATGRVSRDQQAWLDAFQVAGAEAHVLRLPRDWPLVQDVLA